MKQLAASALLAAAVSVASCATRTQAIDRTFTPTIDSPRFAPDEGPLVLIDEAHHNFHTLSGRYRHFAEILRRDGYRVEASASSFSPSALRSADVLVIANALDASNLPSEGGSWSLPTPSAFSRGEIGAVVDFVTAGGSLLLIADHMPFPGAASELADALGFRLGNGFAYDEAEVERLGDLTEAVREPHVFTRDSGLEAHEITEGISQVATFTGQAFQIDSDATSLLTFGPSLSMLLPETAWEFEDAERVGVEGRSQGAVRSLGRGRVAVFGEAAMFTAQLASGTGRLMGLNAPEARDNIAFIRNLLRWLTPDADSDS